MSRIAFKQLLKGGFLNGKSEKVSVVDGQKQLAQ
jgi:hypothetical protein